MMPPEHIKTGAIFLEEGLITPEDVTRVLAIQEKARTSLSRKQARLFGMILCDLNLITPVDNYCTLVKHKKLISVERALVDQAILPRERMDRIKARASKEDLPLISSLLEEGEVEKPRLQQILFDLFHIPFKSVGDILFDRAIRKILSGVVSRDQAARQRCIPLQLTGNTLLMGITDPSNLIFISELDRLFPRYRFTPVFIPFSGFTWFFSLIYKEKWGQGLPGPKELSLAMGASIRISDPEAEREKIEAFYQAYEKNWAARNTSAFGDDGRGDFFYDFLREQYGVISEEYNCRTVNFSLKREQERILVMAVPEIKGGSPWQR